MPENAPETGKRVLIRTERKRSTTELFMYSLCNNIWEFLVYPVPFWEIFRLSHGDVL